MAGPYNPPNPYGSYFTFGTPGMMSPEAVGMSSFLPMPGGMLTPGSLAMTGMGSGGFNPTEMEYLKSRVQNYYQQQFLANVIRNDPRTLTISNALLRQKYGTDVETQNRDLAKMGGRGNYDEIVGTALAMPGISGMLGGSPFALGQGAYAIASSGMNVNSRMMSGDGPMQMWAAMAIVNRMNKNFYGPTGAPNLAMTQGLNRDQIGGLMMLSAGQGAFGGMNLLNIDQKGKPAMDEATLTKISQYTKTAAKGIASLIDIYGDQTIADLATRAQQITGLSYNRFENAGLISSRIAALRQAAEYQGMDYQTMMDMSAGAVRAGAQYGLVGKGLAMGPDAAMRAGQIFNATRSNMGVFEMATPAPQELTNMLMRDTGGMMRDPVGLRRAAMMLAIEQGNLSGASANMAHRLMREGGPESVSKMDTLMAANGMNMQAYIKTMGGPEGIQKLLSLGGMQSVTGFNQADVFRRARSLAEPAFRRAFPRISEDSAEAMFQLTDDLRVGTLESAFKAKTNTELMSALGKDPAGTLDKEKYARLINRAKASPDAYPALQALKQGLSTTPWGPLLINKADEMDRITAEMTFRSFKEENRGELMPGAGIAGLLKRLGGDDPRTTIVRTMQLRPEAFAGIRRGLSIDPNADYNERLLNAKILQQDFGRLPGSDQLLKDLGLPRRGQPSDAALAHMQQILANPIERENVFANAGMELGPIGRKIYGFTKEAHEAVKERGREVITAANIGQTLADTTTDYPVSARSFRRIGQEILDAKDEATKNLATQTLISQSQALGVDFFSTLPPETITSMAKESPMWRDAMYGWSLNETENAPEHRLLDWHYDSQQALKEKHLNLQKSLLLGGAKVADPNAGTTRLIGNLTWTGGKLVLDGHLVAPSTK